MDMSGIDTTALLRRCLQNHALAAELLRLFSEHVPGQLERLSVAVRVKDASAAATLVHRLKGTAATVSADALHSHASELERRVTAADWTAATAILGAVTAEAAICLGQAASPNSLGLSPLE